MPSRSGPGPPRAATRKDRVGKSVNSPYPQWMKKMEEKYQKLHLKIMANSSFNSVRHYSNHGSVKLGGKADGRLSRQSSRTHLSTASNPNTPNIHDLAQRGGDKNLEGEHLEIKAKGTETVQYKGKMIEMKNDKKRRESADDNCFTLSEQDMKKQDFDESDEISRTNKNANININGETVPDTNCLTPVQGSVHCYDSPCQPKRRVSEIRNVNTSVSRTSHKTSWSCPAIMQSPYKQLEPVSLGPAAPMRDDIFANRGRKQFRVFAKMSKEARHAISETLKEMDTNISDGLIVEKLFQNEEKTSVDGNVERNLNVGGASASHLFRTKNVSATVQPKGLHPALDYNVSDHISSGSSDTSITDETVRQRGYGRSRFPLIRRNNQGFSQLLSVRNTHYMERIRIPGVGKYDVPFKRETTFEITPPDFDIRYREIVTCARRDSESPPPDVMEKAVAKCEEWLAKHTPR